MRGLLQVTVAVVEDEIDASLFLRNASAASVINALGIASLLSCRIMLLCIMGVLARARALGLGL